MFTLTDRVEASFKVKGSKFIGHLFPISEQVSFQDELRQIVSKYPDATHHCTAYRIKHSAETAEFSSDDGEPSGTAGLPILNTLRSNSLIQVGAVVVRYYGGTQLGKTGLIEAYAHAISMALEFAQLQEIGEYRVFDLFFTYELTKTVEHLVFGLSGVILTASYTDSVHLEVGIPTLNAINFSHNLRGMDPSMIRFVENKSILKGIS
jgi:uncharacterized YigZ family protein